MSEVEITLKADTLSATREISGFRKEYADLVRAIQKPLSQIDVFEKTKETAKKASTEFFAAKSSVDQLKEAIKQAGQPVKELDRELVKAERSLSRATLEFDRQKTRVREQRAELRAAGVDTKNLATEQQRLQAALTGAVGKGKADAHISQTLDRFGVTKLRDLRAQLVALDSDYKRLTQSGVLSATERMAAEIQYKAQVQETRRAIQDLNAEQSSDTGIGAITARLTALVAAAYSAKRVAGIFFDIADEVNTLEDRLRNALPAYEDYIRTQERLENISARVRIPMAQTSELFLGMIGPMSEAGYSASSVTQVVGALSAALVSNNVKGEQAAAVLNQLSMGMQTGVIRGDAFNAVLTRLPAVVNALTESLGVSRAELIAMASSGKLTTDVFVSAVSGNFEEIMSLADNMRSTVGDASGTLTDKIGKVVGAIDAITGASGKAVKELDGLSGALDKAARGNFGAISLKGVELTSPLALITKELRAWAFGVEETLEDVSSAEEQAAANSDRINNERLKATREYADYFMGEHAQLAINFKKSLDDQVAAQNKAKTALAKAQNETLATQKRYKEALTKLNAGVAGPASFGNAVRLRDASKLALSDGDIARAKKLAQESLDILIALADAGGNTYGFEGFINELQGIEEAADKISVDTARDSFEEAREKTRLWKLELKELENFKISPSIDDAALEGATKKMKEWAKKIGSDLNLIPRNLPQDPSMKPYSADDQGYVLIPEIKPLPADFVIRDILLPGDEAPVINAVINPSSIAPDAPPVSVKVEADRGVLAGVTQTLESMAEGWRRLLTIPLTFVMGDAPVADSLPGYANGTRSAPPGMAWVGERGPELLQFRGGERVFTAAESLRMTSRLPDLPEPSQAVLNAGSPAAMPHLGSLDLNLGGQSYTVYVENPVADQLGRAARKFGRTHR